MGVQMASGSLHHSRRVAAPRDPRPRPGVVSLFDVSSLSKLPAFGPECSDVGLFLVGRGIRSTTIVHELRGHRRNLLFARLAFLVAGLWLGAGGVLIFHAWITGTL